MEIKDGAATETKSALSGESAIFSVGKRLEILPTSDSALDGCAVLVVVGGHYYHLDGLASRLLLELKDGAKTAAQIRDNLRRSCGQNYDAARIEDMLERLVGLAIVDNSGLGAIENEKQKQRSSYFALKLPLLSSEFLKPFTRLLSPLLAPQLIACLFPLLLTGQIIFWSVERQMLPSLYHVPRTAALVFLFIASYVGLFLHEFGHAAACAKFGARHGPIGLALYLIFPALYTDVTDSWRLSKSKRVIVDAAGTYMSLVAATAASILFVVYRSAVWAQLCLIYDLTVVLNLNPFLRMDGYWVLSDVLGIPNLMGANREVTWWILRFGSTKMGAIPRVLYLRLRTKVIYFAYYIGFVMFAILAGYVFYHWYIPRELHLLLAMFREAWSSLVTQGISAHAIAILFQILLQSIPLTGPAIYLVRSVIRKSGRKPVGLQQSRAMNSSLSNT